MTLAHLFVFWVCLRNKDTKDEMRGENKYEIRKRLNEFNLNCCRKRTTENFLQPKVQTQFDKEKKLFKQSFQKKANKLRLGLVKVTTKSATTYYVRLKPSEIKE